MHHRFNLPFRGIHLDFHTSERIPDVGADFDPEAFADTLAAAQVESVCCFARCHHGWLYYQSPGFPERIHPGLQRPHLLREQIEACHARGIRVPIYTTVQWDHFTATHHPEWLCRDESGRPHMAEHRRRTGGFYQNLCLRNPGFRGFIFEHTRELLELFAPDGLFFDMVVPLDCACDLCRAGMKAAGLDGRRMPERLRFGTLLMREFEADMTAFCRKVRPDLSIYYNGNRGAYAPDAFTHLEFDIMPGYGAGGYMNFPLHIRYARTLGLPMMAQTGSFHSSWGDVHSYKHPTALRYELSQLLALGAGGCVGDQLHPRGGLCPRSYRTIGRAFAEVKTKEPWCRDAEPVVDLGVLSPERFHPASVGGVMPDAGEHGESPQRTALLGVARMLDEAAQPYTILDPDSDLTPYRVLVLPDAIRLDGTQAGRLAAFVARGGGLLLSCESGLAAREDRFVLPDCSDWRDLGWSGFDPEYIRPAVALGDLDPVDYVTYSRGRRLTVDPATEILAWSVEPYFQRDYWRFSSHKHTPSSGRQAGPAIARKGRCIYFAHPVFTLYQVKGPDWLATMVRAALDRLLPEPLIRHNGPSSLGVALNRQAAFQRLVLHLLHFIPERRSQELDHIRDEIPLYRIAFSVRCADPVTAVRLAPQGESLPFKQAQGRVAFELPELHGHQMVAIELAVAS